MSKLTAEGRKRLSRHSFAIPGTRSYPIENETHARDALARVSQFGSPSEQARVSEAVHKKYPGIDKEKS